jgi:hypothetical protein
MSKQTPTLEQRIAVAIGNGNSPGSEALIELIRDAEQAAEKAAADADEARNKALDISTDVTAAAVAVTTSQLTCDRLKTALPKLRDRLAAALADEAVQRWHARTQRLAADADKLADEFATEYSKHAGALLDLLLRMAASDREIRQHNVSLPAGVQPVRTAEMLARGLDAFTRDTPSIAAQVVLTDHLGKVAWPVAKPVFSTTVPIPVVPHPGPNWHQALEAAAAERREEWERTVADHERRAKEQTEREEKELAARIAEDRQDRSNQLATPLP